MKRWLAGAAGMAILASALGAVAGTQFEGVVATVDGEPITAADVRAEREESRMALGHQASGGAAEKNSAALELAIRRRLILLDAQRSNLLKGPAGDQLEALMTRGIAGVWRRRRTGRIEVDQADVLKLAPDALMERRKISYIVMTDPEQVRAVHARALRGEDFADLAREFSEGPASEAGGSLGYVMKGEKDYFPEEVYSRLFAMKKGEITPIFASNLFGESFARVDDIQPLSEDEKFELRAEAFATLQAERYEREVKDLVRERRLLLQAARLENLAALPRDEVIAKFAGGTVTAGVFRAYLGRIGYQDAKASRETLEEKLREFATDAIVRVAKEPELAKEKGFAEGIEKARRKEIVNIFFADLYANVEPDPAEIRKYYRDNPRENRLPERVDLAQIRFGTRREAEEALARLDKGEDFDSLAVEFALTDKERRAAGKVGMVAREAFTKDVAKTIFSLGIMRHSRVVSTRFGEFIFLVREKYPAREMTLEERTPAITEKLRNARKKKAFADADQRLRKGRVIKIDQAALAKV